MSTKTAKKMGLHKFIATGGKPKDFEGTQGVNAQTVPGCTCGTKNPKMPKTKK